MLVLTRKLQERLVIDGVIIVQVLDIRDGRVRLGIQAAADVPVQRAELLGQGGHPKHPAKPEAPQCPSSGT